MWLAGTVAFGNPGSARSQSVVEIYQRQWYMKQALGWIQDNGGRIPVLPPGLLETSADSLLRDLDADSDVDSLPPPGPVVHVHGIQRIPKLARSYFENRFKDTNWVFLGADRISPLDTMMTREIRARMEAQFGKPTRTIVDDDALGSVNAGDVFQFEYWFVVNGDIPVVITDVNGPFERGIATSTVDAYGSVLLDLRNALLAEISTSPRKAPFVDYYYDDELAQWYRTGYDGGNFFLELVSRPGLSRPVLPGDRE